MRTFILIAAASCAILAVTLLPGAAALDCGALGSVDYLSGCTNCTTVTFNHTEWHKNKTKEGKGWGGHGWGGKPFGPASIASCTECDTANHFVLLTNNNRTGEKDHTNWKNITKPTIGRCGCADGYGVKVTGNATAQWGNKTKTIPTFVCEQCAPDQVVLSKASGLKPKYDAATGQWTLVLKGKDDPATKDKKAKKVKGAATAEDGGDGADEVLAAASAAGKKGGDKKKPADGKGKKAPQGPKDGKKGGKDGHKWGGDWNKWAGSPFIPGSCVSCPTGSQKQDSACVPL